VTRSGAIDCEVVVASYGDKRANPAVRLPAANQFEHQTGDAEGADMTDEDWSLILSELIAMRADVAEVAESMCELEVGVSRVEVEVARVWMEISQMNLMIARRQRVLAVCAADRARVPSRD
jgi:hypothetical protein